MNLIRRFIKVSNLSLVTSKFTKANFANDSEKIKIDFWELIEFFKP